MVTTDTEGQAYYVILCKELEHPRFWHPQGPWDSSPMGAGGDCPGSYPVSKGSRLHKNSESCKVMWAFPDRLVEPPQLSALQWDKDKKYVPASSFSLPHSPCSYLSLWTLNSPALPISLSWFCHPARLGIQEATSHTKCGRASPESRSRKARESVW